MSDPQAPHEASSDVWYAVVTKERPDQLLAADRSLARAWANAHAAHPDIRGEDLSVRVFTDEEIGRLQSKENQTPD